MHSARLAVATSSALLVGSLVLVLCTSRARDRAEARLAEAMSQHERLRMAWGHRHDSHMRETRDTPSIGKILRVRERLRSPSEKQLLPPRTQPPGLPDFARHNPQLWNDFIATKRDDFGRDFAPLLQRLHLSSLDQERFKEVMTSAVARSVDLSAAADALGLKPDDPAIVALNEESEQEKERGLRELLGSAGFQEFEDYVRAMPLRGFVDALAVQVADTAPLSAVQADELELALASGSESYRNGQKADPQNIDWSIVDQRARVILTPVQVAAWQQGVAENKFGGSRRFQDFKKVYDAAVERTRKDRQSGS